MVQKARAIPEKGSKGWICILQLASFTVILKYLALEHDSDDRRGGVGTVR